MAVYDLEAQTVHHFSLNTKTQSLRVNKSDLDTNAAALSQTHCTFATWPPLTRGLFGVSDLTNILKIAQKVSSVKLVMMDMLVIYIFCERNHNALNSCFIKHLSERQSCGGVFKKTHIRSVVTCKRKKNK